jgi:hypothetical protein
MKVQVLNLINLGFVYLNKLGYRIAKGSTIIKKVFNRLIKINANNLQCRMIYALYLRKIEKDEYETFEVAQQ